MKPYALMEKGSGVLELFPDEEGIRRIPVNLLQRVLTSIVLGIAVFGVTLFAPDWLFCLGTMAFIGLGLYEYFSMLKARGIAVYRVFSILIGLIIPLVVYYELGSARSGGEVLFIVLACLGLFLLQFARRDIPRALEGISLSLFGLMYVSWFLSFFIRIKSLPSGGLLVAYLIIVTKVGDVAAYCIGSLAGRHSLIPHVSQRKTVEGTVAGFLASSVVSVFFYDILPFSFSRPGLFVLGGFIAMIAQCGDLSESLIKRYCEVKDSGRVLPGFGGTLDIMDSVLLAGPLFFFFIKSL